MKKLQKKIFIKGVLKAVTGLHIGGTNTQMGIGGPDSLVIRNPITQKPIIPGSSLKGKIRSLLELSKGLYDTENEKKMGGVGNKEPVTSLFGMSADKKDLNSHASRLIVRDAELSNADMEAWDNTDMLYAETKTEVVINRLTSNATPRNIERIPAGATFDFEMIVNIVSEDDAVQQTEQELLTLLSEGMQLLQDDYLGGNGSRGYGKIKFDEINVSEKIYNPDLKENTQIESYFENLK